MSDYCLMLNEQFFKFSALSWVFMTRPSNIQWNDDIFVLDQHALLYLHSTSSLKQQSLGIHVTSTRTHYSDSEPTSLCSNSLILRALQRRSQYQFNCHWCYIIWTNLVISPLLYCAKIESSFQNVTVYSYKIHFLWTKFKSLFLVQLRWNKNYIQQNIPVSSYNFWIITLHIFPKHLSSSPFKIGFLFILLFFSSSIFR